MNQWEGEGEGLVTSSPTIWGRFIEKEDERLREMLFFWGEVF